MKTCLGFVLPHVSFELAVPFEQVTPDAQLTIGVRGGMPCFVTCISEESGCEKLNRRRSLSGDCSTEIGDSDGIERRSQRSLSDATDSSTIEVE